MITFHFFINERYGWCAHVDPPYEILGDYLIADHPSIRVTKDALNALDDVLCGKVSAWESTGNAYSVEITPNIVHIENALEGVEPVDINLSHEDFRSLLMHWIEFMEANLNK